MPRPTSPFHDLPRTCDADDEHQLLALVADLRRRFARFRRENPRNSRIPKDLRAAVLSAIARGVAAGVLRRTCGLSASQLQRWPMRSCALAPVLPPSLASAPPPRVFSVIGEAATRPPDLSAPRSPADELELRVGPWAVCVRRLEPTGAMRG